ncbi:MAG: SDR family oxidoreductase [Planctomycetes bacterium]|nr:SDR family oxidoreductase [Planctomycetota bacterium]
MRLSGKTAVVTGGGSGIGLAIAEALANEGCRVAIAGRDDAKLKKAASAFKGKQPLLTHAADVGDLASVERLFAWAKKELGQIDILVCSAGVNVQKRLMAELSPEDWEAMMRINATGSFYCLRTVLPEMRSRKDGLIVNISSISGKRAAILGGVGYNASKFAATALGTTVSREEGPNGIRVTNIYPGEVDTPILEQRPSPVSDEHRARILRPSDVADAVLMVACLPPRAHVAEIVIKPTWQDYG